MGDRPIAVWFDAHFHGSTIERLLVAGFHALDWLLIAAGVALVAGIFAVRRRQAPVWLRRAVTGGVAAAFALVAAQAIKFLVGRSQVYPDFLRDGIYAFHPFHGGAFPSATMAGVTAFLVGLDMRPRLARPVIAVAIIFFAAALLITSGHWASDIVAGTVLGLLTGRATMSPKAQSLLSASIGSTLLARRAGI